MNQIDIIQLAKETGLIDKSEFLIPYPHQIAALECFAKAIRLEALESAAQTCDRLGVEICAENIDEVKLAANSLAEAIRNLKTQN